MPLKSFLILSIAVLLFGAAVCAESLNNPYDIFDRHFDAMGGREKLDSIESTYAEGHMVIIGTGLEGSFKNWAVYPDKHRTEADLKVIHYVDGDDGIVAWQIDPNGKLMIVKDEESLKRREISKRMLLNEYADPNSDIFEVVLKNVEKFDNQDCYVIKITNSLNDDSLLQFIDTNDFLIRREISSGGEGEVETVYSDYRDIDGIPSSFRQKTIYHQNGMVQELELSELIRNRELDDSLFAVSSEDIKDFDFTEGDRAEDIPFIYHSNHIYIEVNMGCRHSLWILDTGAGMTVIDSSFADKIGLEFEGNVTGQGAGALVQLYFVSLPEFEVGDVKFAGQKAVAIDLSDIMKKSGLKFDGIMGYDFLSRLTTKIDYANELISFYDPESYTYSGNGTVLDAPIADKTFVVPAVVDGKYEGLWSLDTGAGSCNFHAPFVEKNNLYDRDGIEFLGTGAGGTFTEKLMRFDSFTLAGYTIEKPLIDMTKTAEKGSFQENEEIGNLGNSIMRHFIMTLDYKNQQVIFEPGGKFGMEFPRDRSGMQVMEADGDAIEIYHVAKGTPADKAGLKTGDLILDVNGIGINNLNGLKGFRELLQDKEGTEYSFTVKRGDKIKDYKLKLKSYI